MINSLIGLPGGGKSYEAVAYHVLPALAKRRKVITNLPLNLDVIRAVDPTWLDLVEIRHKSKDPDTKHAFGSALDYSDTWRHPDTGAGPLYVIDECHMPLPRIGTPKAVEEYFALHRHETADILLMTQRPTKVNQECIQLSQMVYRVKKATALGSQDSYIRKVQDGFRGEVVNTSIRKYNPKFFRFYKSHTLGGGSETSASDVIAFWRRWPVIGAAFIFLFLIPLLVITLQPKNPFLADIPEYKTSDQPAPMTGIFSSVQSPAPSAPAPALAPAPAPAPVSAPVPAPSPSPASSDPFASKQLHLAGSMTSRKPDGSIFQVYVFSVSQNGFHIATVRLDELQSIGYVWYSYGECSGTLSRGDTVRAVSCDKPTIAVGSSSPTPI